jgi:hypothetical protein
MAELMVFMKVYVSLTIKENKKFYIKERFIKLAEWRDRQIDKILEDD